MHGSSCIVTPGCTLSSHGGARWENPSSTLQLLGGLPQEIWKGRKTPTPMTRSNKRALAVLLRTPGAASLHDPIFAANLSCLGPQLGRNWALSETFSLFFVRLRSWGWGWFFLLAEKEPTIFSTSFASQLRAPSSTPTPKTPETQTMVWVSPPRKLRPWSEFLLSPVNTESGVVWVLVRVFLGPWSEFPAARAETLG